MTSPDLVLAHNDLQRCTQLFADQQNQIIYRSFVADTQTAVGAMLKLAEGQTHHCLLESVEGGEVRGRFSVIGIKPDLIWRSRGRDVFINRQPESAPEAFIRQGDVNPLDSLRTLLQESAMPDTAPLPPMAAGLFGYLGYDMIRHVEKLPDNNPDQLDVYDSTMMRPSVVAIFDRLKDTITLETEACLRGDLPSPVSLPAQSELPEPKSNLSKERFFEMVNRAKEYISAGDIFQVVLSQRFTIPFSLPSLALYRSLRRLNPSPFLFHFKLEELAIVGSSPEILVRLRDEEVTIRPIAGTRPRGANEAEDAANAQSLMADIKERSEHLMLLDLGRNDVGRVSKPGSVRVVSNFQIELYSHVMHIASEVRGTIRPECDMLDALVAGFPAGTVSGAPKIRAMEIIDELEPDRRGIYAGALGYISATGEMDTCIALRTAVLKGGEMHIQAGAGIVYDSVPQSEFEECQNKARALVRAAADALQFS
ncbi:MAG: anthranilate synthase component I [Proteobacteria bacterium]|nr:anthranilate synthase component I [Pseudomonadota bacterium]